MEQNQEKPLLRLRIRLPSEEDPVKIEAARTKMEAKEIKMEKQQKKKLNNSKTKKMTTTKKQRERTRFPQIVAKSW